MRSVAWRIVACLLVHLLDGAGADPAADYRAINRELSLYSDKLASKPQIVVLNKVDLTETRELIPILQEELSDVGTLHAISAATHEGLEDLLPLILRTLDSLPPEETEDEPTNQDQYRYHLPNPHRPYTSRPGNIPRSPNSSAILRS